MDGGRIRAMTWNIWWRFGPAGRSGSLGCWNLPRHQPRR
jgi:hypothetical protein